MSDKLQLSGPHSADEPQEGRNSCPLLRSHFIGSCHVGVSKRFSRSISPAVYTVSANISITFQATLNLYAYFINHCLAVFCKFLGDFWAFWERDIFLKG